MSEEILLNEYKYEVLKGISVSGSRAAIAQVSHIMNMYKKQAAENAELKKVITKRNKSRKFLKNRVEGLKQSRDCFKQESADLKYELKIYKDIEKWRAETELTKEEKAQLTTPDEFLAMIREPNKQERL